jgi:hypothetical protein
LGLEAAEDFEIKGFFDAPLLRDVEEPEDEVEAFAFGERAAEALAGPLPLADGRPVDRLRLFMNTNLLLNSLYRLCAYDPFISFMQFNIPLTGCK